MKRVNIMTSCDDRLAVYVLTQMASIAANMRDYRIEFYLFHYRISSKKIEFLRKYSKLFENLSFNEILIKDIEPYEKLLKFSGKWPAEAYFDLCPHLYLPTDVDRVLYIDAADVIIDSDIAEYYFGDFDGCSLFATSTRYVIESNGDRTFTKEDMNDKMCLREIKSGVFNSGSFVINIAKLREDGLTMDDFVYVAGVLQGHRMPEELQAYYGDQGLLSVAFVGDIKFFAYPEIRNPYYMPYNFCVSYFDEKKELLYTPKIIHYAEELVRPWMARFSIDEVEKYKFKPSLIKDKVLRAPFFRRGIHIEYFEKWWQYCEMTPIYEELNRDALTFARALETYYLPLCEKYNDLLDSTQK